MLSDDKSIMKDWRVFTLICDHKRMLKLRAEFLRGKGLCIVSDEEIKKYNELYNISEVVLNLFIKYKVSHKDEILEKMKGILVDMKNIEFQLLSELQKKLH